MATPEALAFDMYGTLVDPIRIWHQLERHVGESARQVAELWRAKQLEYTFRLTVMGRYENFERLTRVALDYALAVVGKDLDDSSRRELVAGYDHLEPFADVHAGLKDIRAHGHRMVVLSNGTPRMLSAVVGSAGLAEYFDELISVDEVGAYKPSARVYAHAASRLRLPLDRLRLVSSNAFDVVGAAAAGMQVAWLNRSGGPFDPLDEAPAMIASTLSDLAERLARQPT